MQTAVIVALLCCLLGIVAADLVPQHVYLSLTGDPSSIQVTFTTSTAPTDAQVSYWETGKTPTVVSLVAADTHTFVRPVTARRDYISTVTMTKLTPFTYYNYQIMGDAKDKATSSVVFKFRTLPKDGDAVNVCIYGDLGAAGAIMMEAGAYGLPKSSQAGKFDVIVHNGDFAYNLGTLNGTIGDKFMKNIQQVSAYTPYLVTPGNHEFYANSNPYYNNIFVGQNPVGKSSKSTNPINWFSVDIGTSLHIVGITTEVYCEDVKNIQAHYEWLEQDLMNAHSKPTKPWIVVIGHRPVYFGLFNPFAAVLMRKGLQCTNANKTNCDALKPCQGGPNCAYSIEQLFTKYKVDMFNAGHQHSYMRMYPISDDSQYEVQDDAKYVNAQHPVYMINGAAGVSNGTFVKRTAAEVPAVVTSDAASYSIMTVHNNTHLHYQQISAANGDSVDNFWMVKDTHASPWSKVAKFNLPETTQTECDT